MAKPLTDLLKGDIKGLIELNTRVLKAFLKIKNLFIYGPILRYYNPKLPIYIKINVFGFAIDIIISQLYNNR